ncbi:hypothetical protein [Salinicola peritrichatus]|uniref:hypothetical protein n=1 Tax=Salinicola peritrichatus TaxID=1267424 RepID=UPI0013A64846|nr:hypothetical protein [Salinicola peritrichatus]
MKVSFFHANNCPKTSFSSPHETGALYNGERRVNVSGRPAVIRFIKGDPKKPLLVFIPGTNYMARIAYGGHRGSKPQDFLAFWLNQQGYNFLAISYPLGTASKAFESSHTDLTIQEWGVQIMKITREIIAEQQLSNHVILVGWSMGGRTAQSVQEAATHQRGVHLDFFLSLLENPSIPGITDLDRTIPNSGYADRREERTVRIDQLAKNTTKEGHNIIPEGIFMKEYTSDMPINLNGYKQLGRKF